MIRLSLGNPNPQNGQRNQCNATKRKERHIEAEVFHQFPSKQVTQRGTESNRRSETALRDVKPSGPSGPVRHDQHRYDAKNPVRNAVEDLHRNEGAAVVDDRVEKRPHRQDTETE